MSDTRAETGPMKFGDDWPGTFVRGDDSMHHARQLKKALELLEIGDLDKDTISYVKIVLRGLIHRFEMCRVVSPEPMPTVVCLRSFEECVRSDEKTQKVSRSKAVTT